MLAWLVFSAANLRLCSSPRRAVSSEKSLSPCLGCLLFRGGKAVEAKRLLGFFIIRWWPRCVQPRTPQLCQGLLQCRLYHIIVVKPKVCLHCLLQEFQQLIHSHLEQRLAVQLEDGVGHGKHYGLALQQVQVPDPYSEAVGHPVQEALEKPLEGVDSSVYSICNQVLLQPAQLLHQYLVVVLLEANQLGEARNEEAMHVPSPAHHELTESPKSILIIIEIHEKQGCNLGHALAVANL